MVCPTCAKPVNTDSKYWHPPRFWHIANTVYVCDAACSTAWVDANQDKLKKA